MLSHEPMQMALAVTLPDDETFTSYFGGENSLVVSHLKNSFEQMKTDFQFTYLCGLADSGKSHLLYATCVYAQERGLSTILLSMKEIIGLEPSMLDGLESLSVVCIDDLHLIAGHPNWERAMFNFYNRFNEPDKLLLVASDLLPDMITIQLPDLESRLKWGTTFQIRSMSDDDKAEALVKRAKMRGLELSIECARFLLTRLSRDMRALLDVLDKLDHASMVQQRKLTIPFIKVTLNL
ncbi:DnaA regulatory inactivator Hda [Pseudoalteromonas tunicata]|uniref:Putative regulatory factor involved in inactivation of DnaA n=1 Tax=Pseudoalteromonas tunicata D2 TaxID=87626 RepID=A4CB61_9GAMM|nr:DnaA regulatory inactivator Hda [Pseudoalteromonas tunicata]ATC95158.1 DnaA-homolog protein [Pseudoalteromonas tunicata]EAR28619.1 putative regulatory factor involved in inactivation of DnaA [Pseudoalteromonas tunicata D2]MDP4983364.1 DnaA regulatory inactivator Hda [Pseudoalteromonas tunicata]MDP5215482.1 DnaA regulatory inactivator Hda [Pseudoalteromonas tunicata]